MMQVEHHRLPSLTRGVCLWSPPPTFSLPPRPSGADPVVTVAVAVLAVHRWWSGLIPVPAVAYPKPSSNTIRQTAHPWWSRRAVLAKTATRKFYTTIIFVQILVRCSIKHVTTKYSLIGKKKWQRTNHDLSLFCTLLGVYV